MLRVELADALGGLCGCGVLEGQQRLPEPLLFADVVLRPRLVDGAAEEVARRARWPRLAEALGERGVAVRRLLEPAPHVGPRPLLPAQLLGRGEGAGLLGVEPEPLAADGAEGGPALRPLRLAERLGVVEPAEDVAVGVGREEGVEVVGLEAAAGEALDGEVGQLGEGAAEGLQRLGVAGDVEAEAAVFGGEEGEGRPVAAVDLGEDDAAVLEFGEGLEFAGERAGGAELAPAHAGEVDDGDGVRRATRPRGAPAPAPP